MQDALERSQERERIGWEKFRAFSEHIDQRSIDVYGEASDRVIGRLRRKIEMLGRGSVTIHRLQAGFTRIDQTRDAADG